MKTVNEKTATSIIQKYLPLEWSLPDSVTLTPTRRHNSWVVQKKPIGREEPSQVVLSFTKRDDDSCHGIEKDETPDDSILINSEIEEAVIRAELSNKRWGAKLYGLFPGGRVEEHIDECPLTAAQASDANTIRSLAHAFARLHSIDIPIMRTKMLTLRDVMMREAKEKRDFVSVLQLFPQTGLDPQVVQDLASFDLTAEVTWIFSTYRMIPVKDGLIQFDNNFQNILMSKDGRITFMDMSSALYAPRGIDIGGHFINRMLNLADPQDVINGEVFPPVDERGLFAREYLRQKEKMNPEEFNVDGMDTEGQVLMEADLGALFYALYFYMHILKQEESWKSEPHLLLLLPFFHEFYTRYKLLCKKKYSNWP